MKNTILAISLVLAGLLTVGAADAKAKAKKPQICLSFVEMSAVVDGEQQKVALCQDGSKPVVLTSYTITNIPDEDGNAVRAAIGWR